MNGGSRSENRSPKFPVHNSPPLPYTPPMAITNPTPKSFSQTPWRLALWGMAAALLALPALAMRLTDQVNWALGDFLVFGAMLAGLVGGIEFLAASRLALRGKLIGVALVLAVFALIWIELAVGIFD